MLRFDIVLFIMEREVANNEIRCGVATPECPLAMAYPYAHAVGLAAYGASDLFLLTTEDFDGAIKICHGCPDFPLKQRED
jgi:hypothetical protein